MPCGTAVRRRRPPDAGTATDRAAHRPGHRQSGCGTAASLLPSCDRPCAAHPGTGAVRRTAADVGAAPARPAKSRLHHDLGAAPGRTTGSRRPAVVLGTGRRTPRDPAHPVHPGRRRANADHRPAHILRAAHRRHQPTAVRAARGQGTADRRVGGAAALRPDGGAPPARHPRGARPRSARAGDTPAPHRLRRAVLPAPGSRVRRPVRGAHRGPHGWPARAGRAVRRLRRLGEHRPQGRNAAPAAGVLGQDAGRSQGAAPAAGPSSAAASTGQGEASTS